MPNPNAFRLPAFRADGYLPEGLHPCSAAEAVFRFGSGSRQRKRLVLRVLRWVELARAVNARRLLLDGSFVTSKLAPGDVDSVIFLPSDFEDKLDAADASALELEEMLLTRQPAEIFAAEDEDDWQDWIDFFSRTRESDSRRKGLVEIEL